MILPGLQRESAEAPEHERNRVNLVQIYFWFCCCLQQPTRLLNTTPSLPGLRQCLETKLPSPDLRVWTWI